MPVKMSAMENHTHRIKTKEGASQLSLMNAMNKFVKAVDNMDETVMIPSKLRDMSAHEALTDEGDVCTQALIPVPRNGHQVDLHSFYTTLNAVRTELATGPQSDDEGGSDGEKTPERDGEAEISRQTSQLFRHHLKGLFDVLHQLTDTAEYLTHRYQEDVGEYTPPIRKLSNKDRKHTKTSPPQSRKTSTQHLQSSYI